MNVDSSPPAPLAGSLAERVAASRDLTEAVFATLEKCKRDPGVIPPIAEVGEVRAGEVNVEGEIVELWTPSSPSIQQVGPIADRTGTIKFTIWTKSVQPMVREGQRVRFRAAKKNWYRGRCSIALPYHSLIEFPERERGWEG